jgi:transcriptional regulator with XRE-family HTH domain
MQRKLSQVRPRPNRTLIELRLTQGLSCNRLAMRAGLSGNTVRSAERGGYVDERSQLAIASALGAAVLDVFPLERQRRAGMAT